MKYTDEEQRIWETAYAIAYVKSLSPYSFVRDYATAAIQIADMAIKDLREFKEKTGK